MRVSIHQPAYLPWMGYFDKIARSDVFVFLDTVQFEKNSFCNRNRINSSNGPQWLTVPVRGKGHMSGSLFDLAIATEQPWTRKHIASLQNNYRKAPSFDRFMPLIERDLISSPETLSDLTFQQLHTMLEVFGLKTKIVRSSALDLTEKKSELVLEICRKLGATSYLSGAHGRDYLDQESFLQSNIDLYFQSFQSTEYPQIHGEFVPNLAAVDFLFNLDPTVSPGAYFRP